VFEHGVAMNVAAMTKVQTVNGGFDSVLNEDGGGEKTTQCSSALVAARIVSNLGVAVVGLDVVR